MREGRFYRIWGRDWELVAECFDIGSVTAILNRLAENGLPKHSGLRRLFKYHRSAPFYFQVTGDGVGINPLRPYINQSVFRFEEVPKSDLPLYVGMELVWPRLEEVLRNA